MRGCPWDCSYCHNRHLIPGTPHSDDISWDEVRSFLETRRGLLDGVVFSGGEPTAQLALHDAIAEVRAMGFSAALHTGGPAPERLRAVLPDISWVGFDVKAPFDRYEHITRVAGSGERALESLRAIVDSGVPFEVRTTVHGDLLSADDLTELAESLLDLGVERWILQPWRAQGNPLESPQRRFSEADIPVNLRSRFHTFSVR